MMRVTAVSAVIVLIGVLSMAQAQQVPLFAFTSPDSAAAWQAVNDGVMGGVSDGRFRMTERQTLEFSGTLSNLCPSGRTRAFSYRAPVQTRSREWIEVAVPLDRFEATSFGRVVPGEGPVDPLSFTSIGFLLAEKTPGPFLLEVAWIKVLRGAGL